MVALSLTFSLTGTLTESEENIDQTGESTACTFQVSEAEEDEDWSSIDQRCIGYVPEDAETEATAAAVKDDIT